MRETLHIHTERFRRNFERLAQTGRGTDGGITRPAFSQAHREARHWFLEQGRTAGLATRVDGAGNHSAVLSCGSADAPTLLIGSHLDSVPNGGAYDGALGVVAGLEALMAIQDAGVPLPLNLEVVDFTDEEGRYVGFLGSRALAGGLAADDIRAPRGDRQAFAAALEQAGLTEATILGAKRAPRSLVGYLELHVEQGGRLSDADLDIGIVTGIVGLRSYKLTFVGRANHSGTTPLQSRFDAAQGACAFTLAARELVLASFPESVVNVGNMAFAPGAFNIVPERVTVDLEFRAETTPTLDAMQTALLDRAARDAERFGLQIDIQPVGTAPPAPMAAPMQAAITQAIHHLNLRSRKLPSGAGHDAQSLARVCPTGMLFVPSVGGISHSPQEFTEWRDCVNGANALLHTVVTLLRHFDKEGIVSASTAGNSPPPLTGNYTDFV